MPTDRLRTLLRSAVFAVPALVLPIAAIALARGSSRPLWLADGLPGPVTVEIDGVRSDLRPEERTTVKVRGPVHRARVLSPSGAVLDEGTFTVPPGDFVAYNPLGAAPLLSLVVHYASGPAQEPTLTFLGGRPIAVERHVDHVFEDPPQSIRAPQGSTMTRTVVMQLQGGYRATMGYLLHHGDALELATVGRAAARAAPEDRDALATAVRAVEIAQGFDAAIGFAREALERRPDDYDVHREYQRVMRRADRLDALRAEYRARRDRDPDGVLSALLLARVDPPAEARSRFDEILRAHPDEARAAFAAAWLARRAGDHARAEALLSQFREHPLYSAYVHDHALSLVALGRTPDAVAAVAHALDKEKEHQLFLAVLYHQLARRPDAGALPAPPFSYVDKLAAEHGEPLLVPLAQSLLGETRGDVKVDKPKDKDTALAIEIQIAAGADPSSAWKLCAEASLAALEQVAPHVIVLLAAEFARAGDPDLAERMLFGRPDIVVPAAAIVAYVRSGTEHPDLWRLEEEERAALSLVRARALEASGQSGAPFYEAAEKGDLLQGIVTRARQSWPPLAPPAPKGKTSKPLPKR
jgi:hypothetical protein